MIRTNNPVTPPDKKEPTSADMLAITSIPNQPEPKITVDRIDTYTNDTKTPLIPDKTSPTIENTFLIFIFVSPI